MAPTLSNTPRRPFGVYVLIFALAALVLDLGVDVIRVSRGEPPLTLPNLPGEGDLFLYGAIIVFLVILSVGLWRLHTWAWFAAMVASGLSLFYCIWLHLTGGTPYLTMVLLVIAVFYLNLTEVKVAFRPKAVDQRL